MGASQSSRKLKNKSPMASNEPLFIGDRPSSADSNERAAREDDALLGIRGSLRPTRKASFWKDLALLIWSVFATAAVIILAILYQQKTHDKHGTKKHTGKRNLVFMVSDALVRNICIQTRCDVRLNSSYLSLIHGKFDLGSGCKMHNK